MPILYEITTEEGYCYHLVAETRGKARQAFINADLDFRKWTAKLGIRILEKNVDMPLGLDENWTWAQKHHRKIHFDEYGEWFDGVACQECGHLLWLDDNGQQYCPDCLR